MCVSVCVVRWVSVGVCVCVFAVGWVRAGVSAWYSQMWRERFRNSFRAT